MVSPQAKREAVTVLMTEQDFGVTRACGLVHISRSLYRYRSRRPECSAVRARIEEIAAMKLAKKQAKKLAKAQGKTAAIAADLLPPTTPSR